MRIYHLFLLFLVVNAYALSGEVQVEVKASQHDKFKGFLWNRVEETIGEGVSPQLSAKEVLAAIQEEFSDGQAALNQLEKLKGPGGRLFFELGYVNWPEARGRYNYGQLGKPIYESFPSEDRKKQSGNLVHGCGVVSKDNTYTSYHDYGVGITSNRSEYRDIPRFASEGKFYQLKWASKAQIQRHIARCFSRFPGMPALRPRKPQGPVQIQMDRELQADFDSWLSTIPGIPQSAKKDGRLGLATSCLLESALKRNHDRTGNVIVLERVKHEQYNSYQTSTVISEFDNLPGHSGIEESRGRNSHTYAIAFMDESSSQKLKSKWQKEKIHGQGIWPNFQGGSVASILAQTLGDEMHFHMKACLLSAGLKLPDPNAVLPTIYNPYECREVDLASVSLSQQLNFRCESGESEACMTLAEGHQHGKQQICLPEYLGGQCYLGEGKKNLLVAQQLFDKACEQGLAKACYSLGQMSDHQFSIYPSSNSRHQAYYQKGCKLSPVPNCYFWNRGLNHVDETNYGKFQQECEGKFHQRNACYGLGLYHLQQGDKDKGAQLLKRSCEAHGFKKLPNPCVDLAHLHLEQGQKKQAMEVLKKECSFVGKIGCRELYDLSNAEGKARLIKEVCWQTKKLCF